MNENEELQGILATSSEISEDRGQKVCEPDGVEAAQAPVTTEARVNFSQWEIEPNDSFTATGGTREKLPAGVYRISHDPRGIHFNRANVLTDKLIDLHDSAASEIIAGIRTFWQAEHKFKSRGILFKRGVLLWGPPGSGKSCCVSQLIKELVDQGGFVILCDHPRLAVDALAQVRRIEPNRPLIVVEEDIEEMIRCHGEHALLALLDGENQIDNVVHVATTNFPDQLGARIINRPSRFDEVKKIGMPNAEARQMYLCETAGKDINNLSVLKHEIDRWVADTDGMSIAHLRELVVAVFCLGRGYSETLDRLRSMSLQIKSHEDGFKRSNIGLIQKGSARANSFPGKSGY